MSHPPFTRGWLWVRRPEAVAEDSKGSPFVDSLPGLIATALVGTINVIGLRDEQVQTVLRTNIGRASYVALLVAISLICSVLSITVHGRIRTGPAALLVGMALFFGVLTPIVFLAPPTESRMGAVLAVATLVALAAVGVYFLVARWWRGQREGAEEGVSPAKGDRSTPKTPRGVDLKSMLIVTALILAAVAAISVIRVGSRYAAEQGGPQIGADFFYSGSSVAVKVPVSAGHLQLTDRIVVEVFGSQAGLDRFQARLAAVSYIPDSDGRVLQTLTIPIDLNGFSDLRVEGYVCGEEGHGRVGCTPPPSHERARYERFLLLRESVVTRTVLSLPGLRPPSTPSGSAQSTSLPASYAIPAGPDSPRGSGAPVTIVVPPPAGAASDEGHQLSCQCCCRESCGR